MTNEKDKIRIAIVDDHNLFRKGLIKLINLGDIDSRYSILFEAENGNDLKSKLNPSSLPDIILMDINMPDMDGYQAAEWLNKTFPGVKVLVISMLESEEAIIKMLRLGVKGYLSKDIEVEDMHLALSAIANKGYYYSDFVSDIMAHQIRSANPDGSLVTSREIELSVNEREFIKLACTEMTYQQIADKMNLSPKTIDNYREALFKKFQAKSRVSLAMYAVKTGLVKLS